MRIIRKGTNPYNVEYEHTCWRCGTIFAATKKDMISGQYNESLVKCPVCFAYVNWTEEKPINTEE